MSLEQVVVQSPNGRVITLSPEDVAAGRLADLEGRGYKRVKDAKGPSSNVRPAVVHPEPSKPPVFHDEDDE